MTDYSNQEKDALSSLWNESLQFLCHFHVGQGHWRWLMDSKHDVGKDERRDLMTRFQAVRLVLVCFNYIYNIYFIIKLFSGPIPDYVCH